MKNNRQLYLLWCFLMLMSLGGCDELRVPETDQDEVHIGRLICGGHLSLAVVEKKYQQDFRGFSLKTIQNHDWDDVVKDMHSGKLAGTFILSPLAMQLIRNGLDAKIVMMADRNGNGFILDKKYKSIADLKNKRAVIAVPHLYSQHHVLVYLMLKKHGVPYTDVSIVAMPPRDMINSLSRGEIDGFMVGEPEANRSVSLGVGWMPAISPDIWLNHMDHVFLASNQFIQKHPEQMQVLMTALKKAGMFIEKNPREAAVMGEDYTGASADVFEQVLTKPANWIDYSNMIPSDEYVRDMANEMVNMGLWQDIPQDLAQYTDTRFIEKATRILQK